MTDHPSLTCDVDLDLQTAVLGDRHCGPLGHYTALDCFWHDSPSSGGGSAGARVSAGVTGPVLTSLSTARHLLHRQPQEVPHQLEPVEDEKDPQVVEDHCEAG